MKIINYTQAKTNLRKTLDECNDTGIPVCIVSRKNQMVVISKESYDLMTIESKIEKEDEK